MRLLRLQPKGFCVMTRYLRLLSNSRYLLAHLGLVAAARYFIKVI